MRALLPLAVLGALGALIVLYAFQVEPYWIEVSRYRIDAPVAAPLTIAHVTDLHTRGLGRRERRLLEILEAERPDVILVGGDTIHMSGTYDEALSVYRRLRAPKGVWVVRGNWEHAVPAERRGAPQGDAAFYRDAGVHWLENRAERLAPEIWLVGFDDAVAGKPDVERALEAVPRGAFTIGLFHSPVFFDRVAGPVRLALAGHTHGGQLKLPWLPPFFCPEGCGPYVAGWYEKNGARLYVSRGLGNTILDARFCARPEVTLVTLTPSERPR